MQLDDCGPTRISRIAARVAPIGVALLAAACHVGVLEGSCSQGDLGPGVSPTETKVFCEENTLVTTVRQCEHGTFVPVSTERHPCAANEVCSRTVGYGPAECQRICQRTAECSPERFCEGGSCTLRRPENASCAATDDDPCVAGTSCRPVGDGGDDRVCAANRG